MTMIEKFSMHYYWSLMIIKYDHFPGQKKFLIPMDDLIYSKWMDSVDAFFHFTLQLKIQCDSGWATFVMEYCTVQSFYCYVCLHVFCYWVPIHLDFPRKFLPIMIPCTVPKSVCSIQWSVKNSKTYSLSKFFTHHSSLWSKNPFHGIKLKEKTNLGITDGLNFVDWKG